MRKKLFFVIFFVLLLTASACCTAAASWAAETILLSVPQSVIAEAVSKSVPIEFAENSETLAGTITINRVDNLVLKDQAVSGQLSLSGRDMQLNTSFGSQEIRVNVGNVNLGFTVSATTRYDKTSKTLLLHPTVTEVDEQGSQNGEIGKLIIALFNDRDIPIALDTLQPIITDIGSKTLAIDTEIENVLVKKGKLNIRLLPHISVKK